MREHRPHPDTLTAFERFMVERTIYIMATLQDLQDAVAAETTVVGAGTALIMGLLAKLQAALDNQADPAEIQSILDEVKGNTSNLAAAIAAGTPATPPSAGGTGTEPNQGNVAGDGSDPAANQQADGGNGSGIGTSDLPTS